MGSGRDWLYVLSFYPIVFDNLCVMRHLLVFVFVFLQFCGRLICNWPLYEARIWQLAAVHWAFSTKPHLTSVVATAWVSPPPNKPAFGRALQLEKEDHDFVWGISRGYSDGSPEFRPCLSVYAWNCPVTSPHSFLKDYAALLSPEDSGYSEPCKHVVLMMNTSVRRWLLFVIQVSVRAWRYWHFVSSIPHPGCRCTEEGWREVDWTVICSLHRVRSVHHGSDDCFRSIFWSWERRRTKFWRTSHPASARFWVRETHGVSTSRISSLDTADVRSPSPVRLSRYQASSD